MRFVVIGRKDLTSRRECQEGFACAALGGSYDQCRQPLKRIPCDTEDAISLTLSLSSIAWTDRVDNGKKKGRLRGWHDSLFWSSSCAIG